MPPGPFGTYTFQYVSALPPGCYQRTVTPYAPLSGAFPPEILLWPPGDQGQLPISQFDFTQEQDFSSGQTPVPTFDFARAEGLDGWTAYLRNIKNKRVVSPVVPLQGSLDKGVHLLTNHRRDANDADALLGMELVIAPPRGSPLPAEVLQPTRAGHPLLPEAEPYPSLPTPVEVSGRVATSDGLPVPAELSFNALYVFDRAGTAFPPNFEFSATALTAVDARTGAQVYSVVLPRGYYQMTVRPTDGVHGMSTVAQTFRSQADASKNGDVQVVPLAAVTGQALVADGRAVAEALVEAIPAACPADAVATSGSPPSGADACLPRAAQTVAKDDGTFSLALDPGSYTLRVTPLQGTRLPWVVQALPPVGTANLALPGPVVVPAPVVLSRRLTSEVGDALGATVRVFTQPSAGNPAIELGRAFTDDTGHFDAYLAPPSP
jgi:hypothetical protein